MKFLLRSRWRWKMLQILQAMHQSVLTSYRILKCIDRSWRLMMYNILTQWYLNLIWKLWISALQLPLPLWKNTASEQDANEEKKKNHMTSFSAAINIDVMHVMLFQVGLSLVCQCQTYFATERLIKSSVWSSGILHDSHLFLRSTQDSGGKRFISDAISYLIKTNYTFKRFPKSIWLIPFSQFVTQHLQQHLFIYCSQEGDSF